MGTGGNLTTYIDYRDSINSEPLNQRFINRFTTGIYYGGDLSIISNTSVGISVFDIEFYDGSTLMKCTSSGNNTVTVSTTNIWVVARWSYTGASNDVPTLIAVSNTLTNDVIFGKCLFSGSTLVGFDSTLRSDAQTFSKFCSVEPTGTPSMTLKVRAGQVASNILTYFIPEQITSAFTAPVSNPRIDVVAINSNGNVINITGSENITPVAPTYANNIPLAQILLQTSTTSIVSSMITDVRPFLAFSSSSVPTGAFFSFAGSAIPSGFLLCDGSAYNRVTYNTLFVAIGTSYGSGDGSTTFNVPNMKGNVAVGYNASDTNFNNVGQTGGEETHTLTTNEMPNHQHIIPWGENSAPAVYTWGSYGSGLPGSASTDYDQSWCMSSPTGNGATHNNLQPYLVSQYIIKY